MSWGTFSFAISMWLWGQKMNLLPAGPREGSLPPQLYSGVCWDSYSVQMLCQGSLQTALTSPKQVAELLIMSVIHTEAVEAGCLCVRVCL